MIEINGKVYRNLQEQVAENVKDIEDLQTDLSDGLATKQDTLVSGTNIKTVNGNSLVGSGNVKIVGFEDIEVTVDEYSNGYITAEEYEKISVDHVPVYFAPTEAFPRTTTGSGLTYLYAYEDENYIYYKGTDRFVHAYATYVHNLLLPIIRFSKYIISSEDTRHQVYYTTDNNNYIRYATADIVYSTNSWSSDDPYLSHVVIAGNRYQIDNTPEFGYISIEYGTTTVNLTLDQRNKMYGKHGFMIGFFSRDPIDDHLTTTYYYPISISSTNPRYVNYTLSCGDSKVLVEYDGQDEVLTITYL